MSARSIRVDTRRYAMQRKLSLLALALALIVPACNKNGGTQEAAEITIAVAGPMTGSGAAFGEQIRNAALLKTQEVNDAGGINGKKVKLLVEDDKGDTKEATNVARKLAADKDVCIIIGHFNSTCTNAAKVEYNRKEVVSISAGSTNVTVCAGNPYTFRNLYRDDYQGTFLAHYAKKKLGLKKIAVFYENDDYGKGLMNSFKEEADKIGMAVVATDSFLRERTQDFKPLLQKVMAAEPDGVFVAGLYNEAALICKSAKTDLGMNVTFFGGDGLTDDKFIEIAGSAAEGALITTPFLFNTGNDSPEAVKFMGDYRKAYNGKEPGTWAALTYDAIGQAIEAIKAVGPDRRKIREWLAACTTLEKGYKGVTGVTYFDEEGDCYSKPIYVAVVKGGKMVPAPLQMTVEEIKKN